MKINELRLKDRKTYLIATSASFETDNAFLDAIANELNNGMQIVELRETNSSPKKIIRLGKKIRELCSIFNALFIINDRIDIAQIIQADGIFLNKDSIDIASARELIGNETIIGKNISSKEEIKSAQHDGADYVIYEKEINEETTLPHFVIQKCKIL